jgi:hypothetical protein
MLKARIVRNKEKKCLKFTVYHHFLIGWLKLVVVYELVHEIVSPSTWSILDCKSSDKYNLELRWIVGNRRRLLEPALNSREANKGEQWWQQGYVLGGNSSVNLASHGHCAGVFIGIW